MNNVKLKNNFFTENYLSILSLSFFFLFWYYLVASGIVSDRILADPITTIQTFIFKLTNTSPEGATLFQHLRTSLILALTGFSLGAVIGVPLGLLMGWYKPVDALVRPLFDVLRPIPPIAWIPISIFWFGIGMFSKSFIIFVSAFVPCVINSYTGIRLTNPTLIRVAEVYGASYRETFFRVGVPSAVPMIFTGLKLALSTAWMTLVAAELLAANEGLGYMIQMGRRLARPDIIIVGMLTIGAVGALIASGLQSFDSKLSKWRS